MDLDVMLDTESDDTVARAPRVGAFSAAVRPGALVQAGELLGTLEVLNHRVALRLPAGSPSLRVIAVASTERGLPVGYGDVLASLEAAVLGDGEVSAAGATDRNVREALGLPDDAVAVRAPVDGQFYQRPSPDDPPFVQEGDTVAAGQVLGLVEVMKFFYEVPFESPDPARTWTVARVVARDANTIASGDPIVWVTPVSSD